MAEDFGKIVIYFDPEDRKLLERVAQALESRSVQEFLDCINKVYEESKPKDEIRLGTLRDRRFRVNKSFLVRFKRVERRIVAEAIDLNEFGFGENFSDALIDLQRTIVELYLTLKDEENRLGPDLQKVWETLQEKVSVRL